MKKRKNGSFCKKQFIDHFGIGMHFRTRDIFLLHQLWAFWEPPRIFKMVLAKFLVLMLKTMSYD